VGVERPQVLTRHPAPAHDAIVVGAGPAGLTAAAGLAARGQDVLVVEEHETIGVPVHCTGLIGIDAFDELDLPRSTIQSICQSARFTAPDGESVLVESDSVRAAVVERADFDALLAARARAAGASIESGCAVRRISVEGDGVTVASTDGAVRRARALVLACGAQYRFNRELGLGVPRDYMQTAQVDAPFAARDHIEIEFGRAIAPQGFAWMVPFARGGFTCARLGLMCAGSAAAFFHRYTESLAARAGIDPSSLPRPRLKVLPLGPVRRTYAARVVAVGDAAGLVKPTTGGGIYYGLLSGGIAADVLAGALARDTLDAPALREYETRWRARLGPDIRAGLGFRAVAARLDDRAINAMVRLARVNGIVPLLKQHADFNWHRSAAVALLKKSSFRRIVRASIF
jgi:digeranylgeranylglycerophospholipid reductase